MRPVLLLHASPPRPGSLVVPHAVLQRRDVLLRALHALPRVPGRIHRRARSRRRHHAVSRHIFHRLLHHGPRARHAPLRDLHHVRRRMDASLFVHRHPRVPAAQQHDAALRRRARRGAAHHPALHLRGAGQAEALASLRRPLLRHPRGVSHRAHLQGVPHVQVRLRGRPRPAPLARRGVPGLGPRLPHALARPPAHELQGQAHPHVRHAHLPDWNPRLCRVRGCRRAPQGRQLRAHGCAPRPRLRVLPLPFRRRRARRVHPELHHDLHRPQEDHLQHLLGGSRHRPHRDAHEGGRRGPDHLLRRVQRARLPVRGAQEDHRRGHELGAASRPGAQARGNPLPHLEAVLRHLGPLRL
mmetsp:Transcript_80102/g.194187  ORF Transcript_80102/g.194187 Transcript_80102/m.194187 type:complete len:355 (-) Transcript_80102:1679-2743(-)